MQHRPLGNSNIEASVIALGAWAIGGWMWGGQEEKDSIAAIEAAIDSGVNFIDTAPVYGFGKSEEVVGKTLQGISQEKRDKLIIATKCGLVWDQVTEEHQFDSGERSIYRSVSAESIRKEVEASLTRLKIDCIDLYQTHWQSKTTPIEDTMGELLRLKEQGKIRAIGVSNANTTQIEAYRALGEVDCDQESYSMLDRKHEKSNLPYCKKHDIAFLAYSPLARGMLTGKLTPERELKGDDHRKNYDRFSVENRARVCSFLNKLSPITSDLNISITQLVLAWTLQQPGVTHLLVGARNTAQAIENAKAGSVELTEDQFKFITKALNDADLNIW